MRAPARVKLFRRQTSPARMFEVNFSLSRLTRYVLMLLAACLCAEAVAQAQLVRPFTSRFSTNDTGDLLMIGNTLISCRSNDSACPAARTGTGTTSLNNNDFRMAYVDVDADNSTFNSSRASLALPAGATVLWAGLYWGADTTAGAGGGAQAAPNPAQNNQVRFSTPASGYQTITAVQLDTSAYFGSDYQGVADVTTLVQSGGSGTYTVANVQAGTGQDRQAGWALVVAYRSSSLATRNITVFDGFGTVNSTNPLVTINVSGFLTPTSGSVNTHIGVVAYEGDLGSTGDQIQLNTTPLSDALNGSTNFFNSTITRFGSHLSAKNPNYTNQLGFDIDDVSANGILPNGATSASILLRTSTSGTAEYYYPGVVTFVTDIYAPQVRGNFTKTVTDLNGGSVAPGDVLEYSLTVSNTGSDSATQLVLTDAIPANTTFVAGSLEVTGGAGTGAKTDAAGDDQAEYEAAQTRVRFRLGAGASASAGGSLGTNEATTVRFRVQVNAGTFDTTVISNQGAVGYVSSTLGTPYTDMSDSDAASAGEQPAVVTVVAPPNISLVKSVSTSGIPRPGTDITYTINFSNAQGARSASALIIADKIPADTEFKLGSVTYDAGTTGLPAPVIEYTDQVRLAGDNPPSPWINYTATGAPGTYDGQITYVRFRFNGTLSPNTSGSITFTVRIR